MKDIEIGIVGCGFVGSSVKEGLSDQYRAQVYDKYNRDKSTVETLEDLALTSNIIFICLPTPMKRTGECDITLVQNTVKEIDNISANRKDSRKILVIKSTVPPNTTKALQEGTSAYCDVIFNPEFLTEANHIEDFKNQNRIILGGDNCTHSLQIVKSMYMAKFPTVPYIICGSLEAELTKYFSNCFLATKVSFANEMKQLCESLGADYNRVVESSIYDKRIGNSHLAVPGPDGRRGFGGSCFPKDVNALIYTFEKNDVKPSLLKAVWEKNLEVRPEKDWEQLKGRAVTDD
jgi:UDPglucose 6-dehydrogenase